MCNEVPNDFSATESYIVFICFIDSNHIFARANLGFAWTTHLLIIILVPDFPLSENQSKRKKGGNTKRVEVAVEKANDSNSCFENLRTSAGRVGYQRSFGNETCR